MKRSKPEWAGRADAELACNFLQRALFYDPGQRLNEGFLFGDGQAFDCVLSLLMSQEDDVQLVVGDEPEGWRVQAALG